MTHLNYPMDLYRCKLFDVSMFDFFSDEMLKYLFERKDRYRCLIMQGDQEGLCNYLCGKGTMIVNEMVSEFVQGKHFHWVIWWDSCLPFSHCSMNRFMKIWEKDWDSLRFNPKTSCNCGPLYASRQVYQLENVVEMFKNTDTCKVLDCSYLPSCWGEFVRQVNEKKCD